MKLVETIAPEGCKQITNEVIFFPSKNLENVRYKMMYSCYEDEKGELVHAYSHPIICTKDIPDDVITKEEMAISNMAHEIMADTILNQWNKQSE